jgi:hypothetical protein
MTTATYAIANWFTSTLPPQTTLISIANLIRKRTTHYITGTHPITPNGFASTVTHHPHASSTRAFFVAHRSHHQRDFGAQSWQVKQRSSTISQAASDTRFHRSEFAFDFTQKAQQDIKVNAQHEAHAHVLLLSCACHQGRLGL